MNRRTRTFVATATWVVPILLGFVGTTWIIRPPSPRTMRDGPRSRDDRPRPRGAREAIGAERDGQPMYPGTEAAQATIRFVGDVVTFEDRDARLEGTSEVDPHRTPKAFDLTVIEDGSSVTYPAGIYQIGGEAFRLCFAFPTTGRPTSFATSPGSGRTLFVYRRAGPGRTSIFHR